MKNGSFTTKSDVQFSELTTLCKRRRESLVPPANDLLPHGQKTKLQLFLPVFLYPSNPVRAVLTKLPPNLVVMGYLVCGDESTMISKSGSYPNLQRFKRFGS